MAETTDLLSPVCAGANYGTPEVCVRCGATGLDECRDGRAKTAQRAQKGMADSKTTDFPSSFELLAMASAFELIPFNPSGHWRSIRELKVERRRVNPDAWAIESEGKVLLRDGMWVLEPRPSERDEQFLSEARWPTARDAIAFAREHMAQNPTGYTQEHRDLCCGPRSAEGHG